MREFKRHYLKNMKILFAVVLICQLAFSPLQAFAEPLEVISTVTLEGVTAPKIGASPDFSFKIPANVNYSAYEEFGQWFDNETDGPLGTSDTFLAGHDYYFVAPLVPNPGYMFAQLKDMTADLIGDAENEYLYSSVRSDKDNETNRLTVFLFRAKDPNEIKDVMISGVNAPVDGASPIFTFDVADGSSYGTLSKSGMWLDHSVPKLMDSSDTFVAGHTYTFGAFLKPNEGYVFADPYYMSAALLGDAADSLTQEAIVSYYDDFGSSPNRSVSFTFKAKTALINEVVITGVVEPVAGEVPMVNWGVRVGANYSVYSDVESWYDETEKRVMKPSDPFIEGNAYSLHVWLKADDGYAFAAPSEMTAILSSGGSAVTNGNMINYPHADIRIAEFVFIAKAAQPKIIKGMFSEWIQESNAGLTFTSNAEYRDFLSVRVDGEELGVDDYEVTEGSTIVELKPAFLQSLELGTHEIVIASESGEASTSFDVLAKSAVGENEEDDEAIIEVIGMDENNEVLVGPTKTSDSNRQGPIFLCFILSSVVLVLALYAKKRESL